MSIISAKETTFELFYNEKRGNTDLSVYEYGWERCYGDKFFGPTKREYYLIHYIIKGKGIYSIDNIKISKVMIEENEIVEGTLKENAYVVEKFGDTNNPIFTFDYSEANNSKVTMENAIETYSLYFESNGEFKGIFLKNQTLWEANATYTIEFDYYVVSISGALYIKSYSDVEKDAQLEAENNKKYHGVYVIEVGASANIVLQFFPNAACEVQFDNFKITRNS